MPIAELKTKIKSFTIASGTDSGAIDLEGGTLVGLITPASIASSTFTIQTTPDEGTTYVPVHAADGGGVYTGTIAASQYHYISPTVVAGLKDIKIILSTSETTKTFYYVYRSIE